MSRILTIFLFSILISQSPAEKSVHLGVWSQFSEVPGKPNTYLAEIPSSKSVKRVLLPSSSLNIIKVVIDYHKDSSYQDFILVLSEVMVTLINLNPVNRLHLLHHLISLINHLLISCHYHHHLLPYQVDHQVNLHRLRHHFLLLFITVVLLQHHHLELLINLGFHHPSTSFTSSLAFHLHHHHLPTNY